MNPRPYVTSRCLPPTEGTVTELSEAAHRILWHIKLLIVCALLGLLIPIVASKGQKTTYVSSVRILVTGTSSSKSSASSAADEVTAIATTQTEVASALFYAHANRDSSTFVHHVSATAVGSSGIVNLSVEDTDRNVATNVANSLASSVVEVLNRAGIVSNPLPYVIESATPSN